MAYAVRITDEPFVWLQHVFVEEGQMIAPGADIAEVTLPSGMPHTIKSDCWGVVANVPNLIDRMSANDGLFKEGDIICHIAKRTDRNTRSGDLRPRPSIAMRRLKLGL